jgi:hypothetical protein
MSTIMGVVAALALVAPLVWLIVKSLRRRWRRGRQPSRARVVLVGDQGRTRMLIADTANPDPVIGLRLVSAPPVSTLRMAA